MFKSCTRLIASVVLTIGSTSITYSQQALQTPATPATPPAPNSRQTLQQQGPGTQATTPQQQQLFNNSTQAQNAQSSGQTVVAGKPAVQGEGKDAMIASMLSLCNQKEVQLGMIAKQHTTNAGVKQFAEMMIRDHSEMVSVLQQFGARPVHFESDAGLPNSRSNGDTQAGRTVDSTAGQSAQSRGSIAATANVINNSQSRTPSHTKAAGFDVFDIHREIAQKCLDEAKADWTKKDPRESDMEYVGQQVVAHKEMIITGKVLRNHASSELQKSIDKGIAAAEGHLEEAHKLIKTLASNKDSSNAR